MNSIKKIGFTAIALSLITLTGCTSLKVKTANWLVSKPIVTHADHDQLAEASSKINGIRYESMTTTIVTEKAAAKTNSEPRVDILTSGHEIQGTPWAGEQQVCAMYNKRMHDSKTEGLDDIIENGLALNYIIELNALDGTEYTCRGHVPAKG